MTHSMFLGTYFLPLNLNKGRRGNNPEEAERRSAFSRKLTSDVKNGAKRSIVGHLLPLTTHTFLCKAKAKLLWSGTKISISLKLSLFFILKATFFIFCFTFLNVQFLYLEKMLNKYIKDIIQYKC